MRKHGGTPFRRDKHVTLAAISPPGVTRGRFVGGQQSGLARCKPPPLFTRGASSCSSQGRRQGEPWGASPRPSAPTYLTTCECVRFHLSPTLLYLCSYANFRASLFGAILVHARHRETIDVPNGSPPFGLDCGLGYCCIFGIWLLFRVEGGLHFLYFWILDPGI